MKFSKKTRPILIFVICVVTAGILVTQGQGCSGQVATKNANISSQSTGGGNSSNGSSGLGVESAPSEDIPVLPNSKTVSVVYSKQILEQMSTCLAVKPTDRTIATYENKKGAISVYGTANSITSPMMMAVLSVSGEICQDLILQEAPLTTKRIFKDFDLNANLLPTDAVIKNAISRLALSCWQRKETATDSQILSDMVAQSVVATEAQAGRRAALMICTSMLSSLDALTN